MRWKPVQGALLVSCFIHGLAWFVLGLNLDRESADCCGVMQTVELHTKAGPPSQVLQVTLSPPSVPEQSQATEVNPSLKSPPPSFDDGASESSFVQSKAQLKTPNEVIATSTEFGVIRTHFYEKSELNRFPVLLKAVQFEYETLTPEELQVGQVDLWLYISKSGRVVAVRTEANSLTPATLQVVFKELKKIQFTPGYSSGEPVPAKIRWQVIVDSRTGFTAKAGD